MRRRIEGGRFYKTESVDMLPLLDALPASVATIVACIRWKAPCYHHFNCVHLDEFVETSTDKMNRARARKGGRRMGILQSNYREENVRLCGTS